MNTETVAAGPRGIRKWGCHKLECLAEFFAAFAAALPKEDYYYLEPYAGCGACTCPGTRCVVEDTALRALRNTSFIKYIMIADDAADAACLEGLTAGFKQAEVITGNPVNEDVLRRAFDLVPRSAPTLVVIDPDGYIRLRWSTVKKLAAHGRDWQGRKPELLIVFPLEMALLRNLTRPECEASVTRLYGNRDWEEIRLDRQDEKITLEGTRRRLVALYKKGLKSLGYRFVTDFAPAYFTRQSPYHIISASDAASRAKMLQEAWGKARFLPCELLYSRERQTRPGGDT